MSAKIRSLTLSKSSAASKMNLKLSGSLWPASAGSSKIACQVSTSPGWVSMLVTASMVAVSRPSLDSRYASWGVVPDFTASFKPMVTVTATGSRASFLIGAGGTTSIRLTAGPAVSILTDAPASISVPRLPTTSRAEKMAQAVPVGVVSAITKKPV